MSSETIARQKHEIRDAMSNRRAKLNSDDIARLSRKTQENVISSVHFYSSNLIGVYYAAKSETKTDLIIDEALEHGKKVALPRTEESGIQFHQVAKGDKLAVGKFGIKEPISLNPIQNLDLVIVPGVAFDKQGHRLGYGNGYYDKYLSTTNAYSIGLGYSFQLVDKLPTDKYDIKLNSLATENGIIYF